MVDDLIREAYDAVENICRDTSVTQTEIFDRLQQVIEFAKVCQWGCEEAEQDNEY